MVRISFVIALLFLLPGYQAFAQTIPVVVTGIVPAPDGEAAVYYDPGTGEVTVAVGTGAVGGIVLQTTIQPGFDGFDIGNLDSTTPLGVPAATTDAEEIAFVNVSGFVSGIYEIGQVLDPGATTPEEFLDTFNFVEVSFVAIGQPREPSTGINILPLSIPEPGSIAMLSISGLALLGRRRRSASIA